MLLQSILAVLLRRPNKRCRNYCLVWSVLATGTWRIPFHGLFLEFMMLFLEEKLFGAERALWETGEL
jgi:hypothetical protein